MCRDFEKSSFLRGYARTPIDKTVRNYAAEVPKILLLLKFRTDKNSKTLSESDPRKTKGGYTKKMGKVNEENDKKIVTTFPIASNW